jgi:two-component system, response regulator
MSRARHILVIEDSDEDFETVLDAAKYAGLTYEIRRAITGDEGLMLLRESAQSINTAPDLVLMDLNTPKDDGRHALWEIKQEDQLRAIPLIVLSTSANPLDLAFCYTSGANAYHVKPVDHAVHLQVLQQIFSYWLTRVVLPK